ncbi:hypothetical protein [Flammeovirga agarivorans]|uniref:Lipocalin-like domain-containing protein n=1 Tax=Flammeovirga agarivorans TaxID=2726742 RepID=A0A7X8XVA3_9BACT|nr:hypothetical protein [Flammeovirga agarivorans]NLR91172.1 hypothetical protein [Flammeovirga agarivorans]
MSKSKFVITLIVLAFFLSSCSEDDDIHPNHSLILGSWKLVSAESSTMNTFQINGTSEQTMTKNSHHNIRVTTTFKEDNSVTSKGASNIDVTSLINGIENTTKLKNVPSTFNGSWLIDEEKLILTTIEGIEEYTIDKITENKMVLTINTNITRVQTGITSIIVSDTRLEFKK